MISLLIWTVFGLIAGSIATAILPTEKPVNKVQTIGLGVAGSIVGGIIYGIVNGAGYQPAGLVVSVLGAIACIWTWRYLSRGENE